MSIIKTMCRSPLLCSVAIVFVVASIWMSFAIDKQVVMSPFLASIGGPDSELGKKYMKRIRQRRNLYIQGFSLGIVLSFVYLLTVKRRSAVLSACVVAGVSMLTAYFYYMLSPKKPLMVLELNTDEQRKKWSSIYKTMQWNYHLGLLIGVVGVAVGGYAYC